MFKDVVTIMKSKATALSFFAICLWIAIGLLVFYKIDFIMCFIIRLLYLLPHNNLMPYFIVLSLIFGIFAGSVSYIYRNKRKKTDKRFDEYDFEDSEDPPYGKMDNKINTRFSADDYELDVIARVEIDNNHVSDAGTNTDTKDELTKEDN